MPRIISNLFSFKCFLFSVGLLVYKIAFSSHYFPLPLPSLSSSTPPLSPSLSPPLASISPIPLLTRPIHSSLSFLYSLSPSLSPSPAFPSLGVHISECGLMKQEVCTYLNSPHFIGLKLWCAVVMDHTNPTTKLHKITYQL